jgi:hypothetical protein
LQVVAQPAVSSADSAWKALKAGEPFTYLNQDLHWPEKSIANVSGISDAFRLRE